MKQLSLSDASSGMVLAADVTDKRGTPLLGTGTILTEQHLSILKRRGVIVVSVVDEDDAEAKTVDASQAEFTDQIRHMFEPFGGDALMCCLRDQALEQAQKGMLHG